MAGLITRKTNINSMHGGLIKMEPKNGQSISLFILFKQRNSKFGTDKTKETRLWM